MLTSFVTPTTCQFDLGSHLYNDDMFNNLTANLVSNLRSDRAHDHNTPNVNLDILARDNEYVIVAEIPGMKKEDIKVNVEDQNRTLTISGDKKRHWSRDDKDIRREESRYGFFQRSIKLPFDCDHNALKAKYENGVLELTCKKLPQEKRVGKSIQIA